MPRPYAATLSALLAALALGRAGRRLRAEASAEAEKLRREALLKEYGEVCSNFRLLTDIRFKLLALLPVATAVAVATSHQAGGLIAVAVSLFGLAVTIGLVVYNARNDQLYIELVGRAAAIERSLGLPDGAFANRPRAWLRIELPLMRWKIEHGTGIALIYKASIALWLFGVLAPLLELARVALLRARWPGLDPTAPANWVEPSAVPQLVAFALAVLLTWRVAARVNAQRKSRQDRMRDSARSAVETAAAMDWTDIADSPTLLRDCVDLTGADSSDELEARARFYAGLGAAAVDHYAPRELPLDMPTSDPALRLAAYRIALLTDLPPRWLLDCASERRLPSAPPG
ncbi:hypothetical protein [Rivibacter subsaxonicus]|uniref:Uncharacterized protein n=1 Tax=Rivibacter subsaxonicus TaxID=457575 RepID=A0A4Q7W0A4_9BURK|nr:hypothetical protein [Rivibacter subsaxonicus]RZU02634.1 hypothetical protein EV670_0662 [Rivibacter subsaxonicus]